jgi:TonB family protein
MSRLLLVVGLMVTAAVAVAERPTASKNRSRVVLTESQAAQLSVYTPKPDYPLAARRRYITGHGVFKLYVDVGTGLVRSVEVRQSTGSGILDATATNTYKRWRLKPELLRRYRSAAVPDQVIVNVPVSFNLTNR